MTYETHDSNTVNTTQDARRTYPHKASFYQDPIETERMRAAFLNSRVQTGFGSLSDFISAAILDKVAEVEQAYNAGRPWAPVGAGKIPQGKPGPLTPHTSGAPLTPGLNMPRIPDKELVVAVERARVRLEDEIGARGEVNAFYREDGLQALVEAFDVGEETSVFRTYEIDASSKRVELMRTSGDVAWEPGFDD